MNSDINLIKKEAKVTAKRLKVIRFLAVILAFFVTLSSIALFLLTRQNSIESIRAEQNTLLQNISLLSDKAAKINFLNDRIRNIESIISERKNYVTTVDQLLTQMPSGVSTASLTLDKENLLLTVTSSSLSGINEFLNNAIKFVDEKHLLKDLTVESLSAQNNLYSLTFKAKLL